MLNDTDMRITITIKIIMFPFTIIYTLMCLYVQVARLHITNRSKIITKAVVRYLITYCRETTKETREKN